MRELANNGRAFDLDRGIKRQAIGTNRASRRRYVEKRFVDIIHFRPVTHILNEYRALDDVVHGGTGDFERALDVFQRLAGFRKQPSFHQLKLARHIADVSG